MSEAKFTPGPWFVFGNGHCVGGPESEIGSGQGVAMCGMRSRSAEVIEANAHLIAASPEMYEALNQFIRWYEDDSTEFNRDMAFDAAEKAIAKAKGGEA